MNKRSDRILFFSAVILMISALVMIIAGVSIEKLPPLINSDSLFFQSLYGDVIADGNTLRGWDLNTTFNLLPNAILYLVAWGVSKNPFLNTLFHGILQFSLFFVALYWFYTRVKEHAPLYWHIPGVFLLLLFFADGLIRNDYYIFSLFVQPYHFGAFIMFFILSAITLRFLRAPRWKTASLFIVLATLGVFSNRLLIIMFMIPWFGGLLIALMKKRISAALFLKHTGISAGSVLLGILLYNGIKNLRYITFTPTRPFAWENVAPAFQNMFNAYNSLLHQSIPMGFLVVFAVVFSLFTLGWCIHDLFTSKRQTTDPEDDLFFSTWMWVSLAFNVIVFFTPGIMAMFQGFDTIRYNIFVIIFPPLNIGILAYHFLHQKRWADVVFKYKSMALQVIVLGLLIVLGLRIPAKDRFIEKRDYYPRTIAILDSMVDEYGLKNGVGNYWDAKFGTLFSRNGVKLRQVHFGLSSYPMASARSWYLPQRPQDDVPVFNFILFNNIATMEGIWEIFGQDRVTEVEKDGVHIVITPDFTYTRGHSILVLDLHVP
jgi:hypothetical protein